ncbi:IS66 family transposase [Candidatus Bealeia paramacronuclearis]|uniref:IS66 family transposase n=1 Tax=Candidatus Bealeia paramacronuclearis TaxID=1921001 RepID=A0ABZ2C4X1_9PROT|nr:IS66 family transposase [Candidatus Bealeia paramacronuclearis]
MKNEPQTSLKISSVFDAVALYKNLQKSEKDKAILATQNEHLVQEVDRLTHLLLQMKQSKFGRSSEKIKFEEFPKLPGFENVFDEVYEEPPLEAEKAGAESETENDSGKDKSSSTLLKKGRRPLPAHLPRERVIHDIAGDKICTCGHPLHQMGEEISEQLDYVPAQLKVIQNVRLKYACKSCTEGVRVAEVPNAPLLKSMASANLLAHIIVSKYQDHLPLYRQSQMWERFEVDLGRATMSRWILQIGDLLSPLKELLRSEILKETYVRADETRAQVLKECDRKAQTQSYMWVYMTGSSSHHAISYEYTPTRKGENAKEFLKGFKGYLHTDGYGGYKALAQSQDITAVGCWAHARRKFADIIKSTGNTTGKSAEALTIIRSLYKIEKDAKEAQYPPDKIQKLRQEKAKPILEKFKVLLKEHKKVIVPKSPLGQAVGYVLRQWGPLTEYLNDGRLDIDNNMAERAIRPFAVGRKNWLFMGNVKGALASAVIYSLIETCKANGVNAFDYFRYVLANINSTPENNYSLLLPWNLKHSLSNLHQ